MTQNINRRERQGRREYLIKKEKSYTVSDFSKMFGTSRRTIFSDMKELRTVGVPSHYDFKARGYTIDPEFFLPPVDLNPQEALSLLLLVHKARGQIQLPFKNSALLAALKIENNLPAKIRRYCNTILRNISTRASPQAPMNLLDKTFAQLQHAIGKRRKVTVEYNALFEGKVINIELCPYHLLYNRRAWYVLGGSSLHNSVRTFKLGRIKTLKVLDKCFIWGEDFDLADYLGKAWSMIPEGRIYHIKLRFLLKVANNVTKVQWHSTQKVRRNSDGSVMMEFRVDGVGEIVWWILGYGDQVQVLSPKVLRKKVLGVAENVIRINKGL